MTFPGAATFPGATHVNISFKKLMSEHCSLRCLKTCGIINKYVVLFYQIIINGGFPNQRWLKSYRSFLFRTFLNNLILEKSVFFRCWKGSPNVYRQIYVCTWTEICWTTVQHSKRHPQVVWYKILEGLIVFVFTIPLFYVMFMPTTTRQNLED